MPIPPNEVPDGGSAEDYAVWSVLYTLMEQQDHAIQATLRATKLAEPESSEQETRPVLSDEQAQKAAELGQKFAQELLAAVSGSGGTEGISDMMQQMRQLAADTGASEDDLAKMDSALSSLLGMISAAPAMPPRTVPEGLSAQEYYDLGVQYKAAGWTEQSRDALQYAIELGEGGDVSVAALNFLRSKLPRHPVPLAAEQANIHGFNEMVSGNTEAAIEIFERLIREQPDFEWPQGNLGSIMIARGDLARAEEILVNAVQLNPFYLNGWSHLCRANILQSKYQQARHCIEQMRKIDPSDDSYATQLEEYVEKVQRWEESGGS